MASKLQNSSVLSRWGVGGIRILSFVGERKTLFDGLGGGVWKDDSFGGVREIESRSIAALPFVNTNLPYIGWARW